MLQYAINYLGEKSLNWIKLSALTQVQIIQETETIGNAFLNVQLSHILWKITL